MRDSLDEIDWSALEHAYGSAGDTPGLIRRLRREDWPEAVEDLLTSILHQGSVYSATLAALPYLVEVALDAGAPGRLGALQILYFYGQSVTSADSPQLGELDAEARAGLERSAQALLPLAQDPDPEARIGIYESAGYWREESLEPDVHRMLRERFTAETEAAARVVLMEPLARHGLLTSADLDVLLAAGQDEVLFAALWSALAGGSDLPSGLDHLVRLWPTHAPTYPGMGAGNSIALLVQEGGARAVPLLQRLAALGKAESGVSAVDLASAWAEVAQRSRSATPSAVEALIGLTRVTTSAPSVDLLAAQQLVEALFTVLPAVDERAPEVADGLAELLERIPGPQAGAESVLASIATALFLLRDARWSAPALAAVRTGEHVMVRTDSRSSTSFPVLLTRVCAAQQPLAWAEADLAAVAQAAMRARPSSAGAWAEVLNLLPPSSSVVEMLLSAAYNKPEPVVLQTLTELAAADPGVFTPTARAAVAALPVTEDEAGAWLLTTQALLAPGEVDASAFGRARELGGNEVGRDDLLRIWASHPSPELERACREQFTGAARKSFPERHLQLAAAAIVAETGDPDLIRAAWPTVRAVLDRAGEPLTAAAAIAERIVELEPEYLPEWVAQLRDIVKNGRETWSGPDLVASAVAVGALLRLGETPAEEALERALELQAEAVATGRVVRVTPILARVVEGALAQRPDLRPRAVAVLEPLITSDRRFPTASDDIAVDLSLVRTLRGVLEK